MHEVRRWAQTRWWKACHMPNHQNLWKFRRKKLHIRGEMEKFEIYHKATGASKKPDEMKEGLLLNHIGDSCLEIYSNFVYLPERDDPVGGKAKLPAENLDNYTNVLAKFVAYFQNRDPELMLREKFWLHLRREPAQTFDSWVVTIKERASECKFPFAVYEQAVRYKLIFLAMRNVINQL